jgi:trk system potassium uptake protein TrkH
LAAFTLLPIMLAVPLYESIGNTVFLNTYFEMVSSLSTTGASAFDDPGRLNNADHLWRALVGWLGGFLIWVTAVAILAPLSLGGFEVLGQVGISGTSTSAGASTGNGKAASKATSKISGKAVSEASGKTSSRASSTGSGMSQISHIADPSDRLRRYTTTLFPIYAGLTVILWILLLLGGDTPIVAICHAMSTLATSGISPIGGTSGAPSGIVGEMMIFLFLGFALSRQTFARDTPDRGRARLLRDPEMQMGLAFALGVPVLLFIRHWLGALEVDTGFSLMDGLSALWGGIFTVLSFLSTTGFESSQWEALQNWSGLTTPGLILLGLAMIGGGVATTAGGVKLLRVYVLYMHGRRELERLVHPSSIGSRRTGKRSLRRQGAYAAWIFFMLLALSVAAIMLALSLTGLDFESSVIFTIAAVTTTGPLAAIAGDAPLSYGQLSEAAKLILAASMVVGRLETLAIIALLNPEFWRS